MTCKKIKTFELTSFTKGGAVSLFNFYKKNMGVELISEPTQMKDGTDRWKVVMTHPFPEGS